LGGQKDVGENYEKKKERAKPLHTEVLKKEVKRRDPMPYIASVSPQRSFGEHSKTRANPAGQSAAQVP
jgi:hypothetical protein